MTMKPCELVKAFKAVDRLIWNLGASDFASDHGSQLFVTLRDYRVDMARDIYYEMTGEVPSDEELQACDGELTVPQPYPPKGDSK